MTTSIQVYDPMSAYNSAINKLEKNGIRATKQRRVLAKLIFEKGRDIFLQKIYLTKLKKKKEKFQWPQFITLLNNLHHWG